MSRKREFTAAQMAEACRGSGGIMALVAKKLGCDRSTVSRYAKAFVSVREALEQADEEATDMAEAKSVQLIQAGYWPAVRYRLSTKGKKRGYTERREITGAGGEPIEHRFPQFDKALERIYSSDDDGVA